MPVVHRLSRGAVPFALAALLALLAPIAAPCTAAAQARGADIPSSAADSAAAARAISRAAQAFSRAMERGDAAAMAAQYTPDAVLLPPNGRPVAGIEAIRRFWTPGNPDFRTVRHELTTERLEVTGDAATELGRWRQVSRAGGGPEREAWGRYLVVWRHEPDGAWRMQFDSWTRPVEEEGGEEDSPEAAVREAVQHYLDGHATGDGAHHRMVFHPESRLFWIGEDGLRIRTSEDYIAGAPGRPAPDEDRRRRRIAMVDVTGTAAVARVELDHPGALITDYFTLLRIDGEWRIVNKIFHVERRERNDPPGPATDTARTFVERLGTDTLQIERIERRGDVVTGTVVSRSPATQVTEYRAVLGDDGWIRSIEGTVRTPEENPQGPPARSFEARIEGDSLRVSVTTGDSTRTGAAAAEGLRLIPPKIPWSAWLMETAAARLRESGADTLALGLRHPLYAQTFPSAAVLGAADTLRVLFFGDPMLVALDERGRVRSIDGRQTTMKVETVPADDLDLDALASDFARRDAAGAGIGRASPAATAEGTVAGAEISVTYSRPAMRGRQIWGGLVPFGEVWRTGANAATTLTTDRDLVLGGTRLPAGSYTLWSLYGPDSATLIVNAQTGQWGTAYDPERDFARIPMDREPTGEPVERFTIAVEEAPAASGADGRLTLAWDGRRYFVPFRVVR